MNLIEKEFGIIEKYGSYQNAKSAYLRKVNEGFSDDDFKSKLLEYRRQNNIFEIGDLVVFKEEYSKDSVIHKIDSLRAGTKCLRHATDEEIDKGYRL